MNLSHPSHVATVFRILTSNGFDGDHEDDDKGDYFHPEASPLIKIILLYEQPQGTGLHLNLTLDPALTTESLKIDLANVINVPAEFMKLIHLNTVLEDDKSLCNQSVEPNATIVLRDSRLTYNFP
ncbi:unnamed protein product [Candidula unifasciata]|uniref:Ubiquitin-like domain-containing protein n=1 Tax=Candidula unifasciata TaxID=100452 RepID=A0A8S3Z6T3_9EUPU|nr:unnamed protein product [Candidula unifasciata]